MRGFIMEHNPLLSISKNQMEITYSDIKTRPDGSKYTTIYFERPNGDEFVSAKYDYPGTDFSEIKGIGKKELEELRNYVCKLGSVALDFSKEKEGVSNA